MREVEERPEEHEAESEAEPGDQIRDLLEQERRVGRAVPLAFVGGEPLAAAVSVLLLVMAGSAFWVGSGRLADNVLSVASSSCPEGLDRG